jgi:hypothetical protein
MIENFISNLKKSQMKNKAKTNKWHKYLNISVVILIITMLSCTKKIEDFNPIPYSEGTAILCKWKDNKKAALTFNFDDSSNGQATLAVPALNEREMKGTFYVNPGNYDYGRNKSIWEVTVPASGHELANHTMHHAGASTYDETLYEVGEVSRIIWAIRGDAECGSLIAFNRGGGTNWNEEWLAAALTQFCNYDRMEPMGESFDSQSVEAGSTADQMYVLVDQIIQDGRLGRFHFHGIAAENGNPPNDGGLSGVWINEFKALLDKVKNVSDQIWQPTFSEAYKYAKERNNTTFLFNKKDENSYTMSLDCTLDKKYYNQELSIIVCVPKSWSNCNLTYNGSTKNYEVKNGFVVLEIKPGYGPILLEKN